MLFPPPFGFEHVAPSPRTGRSQVQRIVGYVASVESDHSRISASDLFYVGMETLWFLNSGASIINMGKRLQPIQSAKRGSNYFDLTI